MRKELLTLAADLAQRGEPYVFAVVVRREPASSAQPGDMALITEAGAMHGWLGGSCVKPTILREAKEALREGRPRVVALSPEPARDRRPGVVVHPMTCHSGGTVDIYLEPVLPAARLVVFGTAPTARALCRLGKAMGWVVEAVDPDAERAVFPDADAVLAHAQPRDASRREIYVVVATMGQRDEEALREALALEPTWAGVVASRKRYAELRETLVMGGASASSFERVKNPAGLDLGGRTAEEIALSIVAEVVRDRRAAELKAVEPAVRTAPVANDETAIDPICGMTVVIAGARHVAEHGGRTWYFCNPRCRERFLATPERWAAEVGAAS